MHDDDPINAIEQLSRWWPKDRRESEPSIRDRLNYRISDDLPLPSLRTSPGGWKLTIPPLRRSGVCKCMVTEVNYPFECIMVQLHLEADGWVLDAFDSQCPVCFGNGINNGCPCNFCFAAGWGVFGDDYLDSNLTVKVIEQLVTMWPKSMNEPEESIRSRLRGSVTDALPLPSLRTVPAGSWRIACPPLVSLGVAKCLLVDTNYPKTRVLIELHAQSDGWLLTAFDAECPVCFGTGINNDCVCDLCFGVGWGTR